MQTLIKVIKFTVSLISIGVSLAHCLAAPLQELDLIPAQNISQPISLSTNATDGGSPPTASLGPALLSDNMYGLAPESLMNDGQVTMNYILSPAVLTNSIALSLMNMPSPGVAGYPEILYGYSPNSTSYSSTNASLLFPMNVSNLVSLESSGGFWAVVNYTVAPAPPTNPVDFTYDIWITSGNAPIQRSSTTVELMIWLYDNFTNSDTLQTNLSLSCLVGGLQQNLSFDVYASTNPPITGARVDFVLETPVSAGTIGVDISKIVSMLGPYLQAWYNNPTWNQTTLSNFYVLDIELGSEFKGDSLLEANYDWAISQYYFLYPTPQLLTTNTLSVTSSNPGSGVSIAVSPNDTGGNGSGSTPFMRAYTNNTQVTLTAPSTAGGNNFQKWQQNSADYSTSLSAAITMTTNYTMTAVYTSPPSATYTLTVASSNPNSSVSISASPSDKNGIAGGTTPFTLTYNSNTVVTLTAPATTSGNDFYLWQQDGVTWVCCGSAVRSTYFTMNGSHTMTAVYGGISIIALSGNLSFGTVQAGASAVRTFTIQSQGGYQPLHVSGITYPPGFSGAWSGTIPIGSSTNVVVTFAPTTNGFYSGLVTVNSDATLGSNSIAASGTGVVAPPPPPVTPFSTGPFTVIYSFPYQSSLSGPWAYGANPETRLVQGTNGDFYGSTYFGGSYGDGVIFRMNAAGSNQLLYVFPAYVGQPNAKLTLGSDGNLYGITQCGGAHGDGSVFKMASGVFSTNYSFAESSSDHSGNPVAPLIQGRNGVFYGTTYWGWDCSGSAFAVTSTGTFTLLTDFDCGIPGVGSVVIAPLIQGSDGNLYGTTFVGGTNNCGTVFQLALSGNLNPLYSFTGGLDGANPQAGLVQDKSGYLYGTTSRGGSFGNGTVFKMATNGNLIWVVSFNGTNGSNGGYGIPAFLEASLIQASDGNLYGVAPSGGTFGDGTVFQINTNGLLAVLHSFQGSDGANPFGLMQGRDGNLYGTTWEGGTDGGGTVFRLVIPLGTPSVTTTGGVLNINWNAVPGQTYQVQYSTDLRQTNWVVLISAITPTNSTATATDAVGPDSQRFYRIVEFPEAW